MPDIQVLSTHVADLIADISEMPSTTKVTMVTPVVRERLKSHGLCMLKMPKKMPKREANRAIFSKKTTVRFSFFIIPCKVTSFLYI